MAKKPYLPNIISQADLNRMAQVLSKIQSDKALVQTTSKIDGALYEKLEMSTSAVNAQRPASEDILDLMRLAVDTNDREWFEALAKYRDELHAIETLARAELGFEI